MNWEGFRTLLLTVLVLLSFVLTWNLWTNQSGSDKSEGSNFVNSDLVSSGGKKKISQVVQPDRAIYFDGTNHYGFDAGGEMNSLFQAISGAKFQVVYTRSLSNNDQKENLDQKLPSNSSKRVELLFPTRIPLPLFGKILGSSGGKTADDKVLVNTSNSLLFDHIIFSPSPKNSAAKIVAYFMNGSTVEARSNVSNVSFSDMSSIFAQHKHLYLAKTTTKDNSKVFYLPAEPKVKKISYRYNMISADKFKNALFPNTNVTYQSPDYYQSESLFMRASDNMIKYINTSPGSGQSKSSTSQSQTAIETGFNYINSHSGWTDHYLLFHYIPPRNSNSSSKSITDYRLFVGNEKEEYPVFSSVDKPFVNYHDAGTIHLTVQNGDVSELFRTMIDLDQQTLVKKFHAFKTGSEVWEELTSSKAVNMKLVNSIRVGYQMKFPSDPSGKVTFSPKWYVLYNGSWQTIDDLTGNQGEKGRAS